MTAKILFLCLALLFSRIAAAGPVEGFQRLRSDPSLRPSLEKIIQIAVHNVFGENQPLPKELPAFFRGTSYPVFITARKGDEVRGCMGSLNVKTGSLAEEIAQNLKAAFTRDLRHRPIRREEVGGMEIFVTAVGAPSALRGWESVVPARDAILLKSGSKEAVVLPGEAKTLRYLKAFARAKAGIGRDEAYQLFKLPTATVSVKLQDDLFATTRPAGQRPALDPPPRAPTP